MSGSRCPVPLLPLSNWRDYRFMTATLCHEHPIPSAVPMTSATKEPLPDVQKNSESVTWTGLSTEKVSSIRCDGETWSQPRGSCASEAFSTRQNLSHVTKGWGGGTDRQTVSRREDCN